jgi:hypothetical protein
VKPVDCDYVIVIMGGIWNCIAFNIFVKVLYNTHMKLNYANIYDKIDWYGLTTETVLLIS